MKELFLNSYMNFVLKYKTYTDEEIEKMRYSIEGIYLTITKLVVIVILGLLLGILKEIVLLLLFYNFLRYFGFGYHASGSKECLIISITFFVIFPFLACKDILIFDYKNIIAGLCILNFLLFAPSDTVKRPMINKKKKLIRKSVLLIISFIYIIIMNYTNDKIANLIVISLIIECIMVNPIIYKITGQPYANYKQYKG